MKVDKNNIVFLKESLLNLIEMVEVGYSRLVQLLNNYSSVSQEEIIMQAWCVIGNLNRLRCLIRKGLGIKKKEPWFQLFARKIKGVEDSRHFIEHYDEKIDNLILMVKPLLGHLSWIIYEGDKKLNVLIVIPGRLRKYKNLTIVNPAGKNIRAKIDHITYFLGNYELNISEVYFDLIKFKQALNKV